jgi:hypothetical protein
MGIGDGRGSSLMVSSLGNTPTVGSSKALHIPSLDVRGSGYFLFSAVCPHLDESAARVESYVATTSLCTFSVQLDSLLDRLDAWYSKRRY